MWMSVYGSLDRWTNFILYLAALFLLGVAIHPTCVNLWGLERMEPNLIHFKWDSRVNGHSLFF